VICAGTAI